MTAIAVKKYSDKIVMSSDSMESADTELRGSTKKIFKYNDILIGAAGTCKFLWPFIDNVKSIKRPLTRQSLSKWIQSVCKIIKKDFIAVEEFTDDLFALVIVGDGKIFEICGYDVSEVEEYTAIGIGWYHCVTALDMGSDTKTAIEMACKRSTLCGLPVHTETVGIHETKTIRKKTSKKRQKK